MVVMKLFFIFLILYCGALTRCSKNQQSRPHIIFILADDLGWNDVGFHGSNQISTPNIDILAYTGVILNNYYVLPICTPTRSALMTGKYPIHTGLQHGVIHGSTPYGLSPSETLLPQLLKRNDYITRAVGKWHLGMQHKVIYGNEPWGLGLNETLLSEYLQRNGYTTKMVGKWHLGHFRKTFLPEQRGFDSHYGYWVGHQDYYDHSAQEKGSYWGYDMKRGMNSSWSDYGLYSTDLFTAEAVKIIKEHRAANPLFLYIAHLAVHSANSYNPLQAPPEATAKYSNITDKARKTFAGMLSKLDESVGEIISALSERKILNNSIIIFSTDNGGPAAGFNSNAASNWPLRGVKDTLWEGGVRGVGFIWSSLLPSGVVSDALMHVTDWLPTLLNAVEVNGTQNDIDGLNLWNSLISGAPSPRNEVVLNIDTERNISGLIHKNWKLIKGRTWEGKWDNWYGPSGREETYCWEALYQCKAAESIQHIKLIPSRQTVQLLREKSNVICANNEIQNRMITSDEEEQVFLFNLFKDPCEMNNLASSEKSQLQIMENLLMKHKKTMVNPRNQSPDPRSHPKFWGYQWINWMDYL